MTSFFRPRRTDSTLRSISRPVNYQHQRFPSTISVSYDVSSRHQWVQGLVEHSVSFEINRDHWHFMTVCSFGSFSDFRVLYALISNWPSFYTNKDQNDYNYQKYLLGLFDLIWRRNDFITFCKTYNSQVLWHMVIWLVMTILLIMTLAGL